MVIKKEELEKKLTERQKNEVERLEKKIDATLEEEYVPGERVIVHLDTWPHARVIRELKKKYQEAGWKIEFRSDQRDGHWVELF